MTFGASHITSSAHMHRPEHRAVCRDVFVMAFTTFVISDDLLHLGKRQAYYNKCYCGGY